MHPFQPQMEHERPEKMNRSSCPKRYLPARRHSNTLHCRTFTSSSPPPPPPSAPPTSSAGTSWSAPSAARAAADACKRACCSEESRRRQCLHRAGRTRPLITPAIHVCGGVDTQAHARRASSMSPMRTYVTRRACAHACHPWPRERTGIRAWLAKGVEQGAKKRYLSGL